MGITGIILIFIGLGVFLYAGYAALACVIRQLRTISTSRTWWCDQHSLT